MLDPSSVARYCISSRPLLRSRSGPRLRTVDGESSTGLLTTTAFGCSILAGMDRAEQLRHLPLAYAIALRLHDAGVGDAQIAAALAIEQECVAPLLDVGRAKAARIVQSASDGQSAESS